MSMFQKIDRIFVKTMKLLSYVAPPVLIFMALLATVNVLMQKIFITPIPGNIYMISYLLVVVVYFAVPYEQTNQGFLSVDVFYVKYNRIGKIITHVVSNLLGIGVFGLLAYGNISSFRSEFFYKTMSEPGRGGFVVWPFYLIMVVMCGILALTYVWNIVRLIAYRGEIVFPREGVKVDEPLVVEGEEGMDHAD